MDFSLKCPVCFVFDGLSSGLLWREIFFLTMLSSVVLDRKSDQYVKTSASGSSLNSGTPSPRSCLKDNASVFRLKHSLPLFPPLTAQSVIEVSANMP